MVGGDGEHGGLLVLLGLPHHPGPWRLPRVQVPGHQVRAVRALQSQTHILLLPLALCAPANRIFGLAIVTSSVLNLLVPGATEIHPSAVILVRVCQGLVEVSILREERDF